MVNLSFSFRTPSTSSPDILSLVKERAQEKTLLGNENSSLAIPFSFRSGFSFSVLFPLRLGSLSAHPSRGSFLMCPSLRSLAVSRFSTRLVAPVIKTATQNEQRETNGEETSEEGRKERLEKHRP